jgi:hypothetical protein
MKKTLVIFIILFISTQSQAVHLSSNGMGQVLIFPYYTVNNGLNTLMNIVNTTDQSKALKVRFRDAANSKETFAFNLYLGPYDVWTGGLVEIFTDDDYGTKIISSDISCTIPNIDFSGQLFTTDKFTGDLSDAYGNDTARIREGFIEVIEMGSMQGDSAAATIIDDDQSQPNCSLLQDAWDATSSDAYWLADPTTDMLAPSGGIMGNIILIDVENGIAVTEEPTVLGNFSDSILHFAVEDASPNLADGMTLAQVEYKGSIIDINWDEGFEAVSSVLMKDTISNEYVLEDSIGANTDWIITLPTRQFHLDIAGQGPISHLAPFTEANSSTFNCEPYEAIGVYDREAQLNLTPPGAGVVGSPPPPGPPPIQSVCFASNYIHFSKLGDDFDSGSILGGNYLVNGFNANLFRNIFQSGWVDLGFTGNPSLPPSDSNQVMTVDGTSIYGLPVIGFSVQRYVNSHLSGGILANYAGLFNHKSNKSIVKSDNHTAKSGMIVSEQGVGQVLLFPYYTVKNGMNTLISIANTTDEVKAVKIRFKEGTNGRDTLDFNIYLSPFDVWTAGLVAASSTIQGHVGEESTKILTFDHSCTVPVAINGQEFLPYAFTGAFDDAQGANIQRVQEGSIEIIEMGTVIGFDAVAATHTASGVPASCSQLNENWTPAAGQWIINSTVNMTAPDGSGGIFASVSLIDVAGGVDMTMDATAIVGYSLDIQHTDPASLEPNLSTGNQSTTLIETEGGFIQTTWETPVDAVSALFMQSHVINDFVISPSIGAQTEWVNAFPTKPFYVDPLFTGNRVAPEPPFNNDLSAGLGACEYHRFNAFDRNQHSNNISNGDTSILPPLMPVSFPEDCWSVVVSDVNNGADENSIFGSEVKLKDLNEDPDYESVVDLSFIEGWMQIDFVDEVENPGKLIGVGDNGDVHEIFGKPVLGFVAQKYINNQLTGGVLANYATINKNKGRRKFLINEMNSK